MRGIEVLHRAVVEVVTVVIPDADAGKVDGHASGRDRHTPEADGISIEDFGDLPGLINAVKAAQGDQQEPLEASKPTAGSQGECGKHQLRGGRRGQGSARRRLSRRLEEFTWRSDALKGRLEIPHRHHAGRL